MVWVTELRSFFISRQKMTSVHAINHTTVSSKFHSLNEITWELEHGAPSRAKSHTLSSKTRPARKHPPNQCTQTDTHSYTHTVKAVSLSPSMALCSLQQNHLITRQIQSVITALQTEDCILSVRYRLFCRWRSSDYMCDSVRVPVCVLMLGSQQRWSSLAIHRDAASRERSITASDMCQVYYVRSFTELIYFVAVCFNQGHSV